MFSWIVRPPHTSPERIQVHRILTGPIECIAILSDLLDNSKVSKDVYIAYRLKETAKTRVYIQ